MDRRAALHRLGLLLLEHDLRAHDEGDTFKSVMKMAKMVTIHETTFEGFSEAKIVLDHIINDALSDHLRSLDKRLVLTTDDCASFGAKVLKIVKDYLGDEW